MSLRNQHMLSHMAEDVAWLYQWFTNCYQRSPISISSSHPTDNHQLVTNFDSSPQSSFGELPYGHLPGFQNWIQSAPQMAKIYLQKSHWSTSAPTSSRGVLILSTEILHHCMEGLFKKRTCFHSPHQQIWGHHHHNKWCLVVDLSYPTGHSVNDGIPKTLVVCHTSPLMMQFKKSLSLVLIHYLQRLTLKSILYTTSSPNKQAPTLYGLEKRTVHWHLLPIWAVVSTQVIQYLS